jgi:hypothetical protein
MLLSGCGLASGIEGDCGDETSVARNDRIHPRSLSRYEEEYAMKVGAMFPSNYLKADDLGAKKVTVTMTEVKLEVMPQGDKEEKPVLYFRNSKKGLVLNVTNAHTIAEAYGDDTDGWKGKQVILYVDNNVQYAGKRVKGLRVMVPTTKTQEPEDAPEEDVIDDEVPPPDDDDIVF